MEEVQNSHVEVGELRGRVDGGGVLVGVLEGVPFFGDLDIVGK